MTSPQQLEILDLRHFSARQLRPLLEREARLWERRLRWEYQSSTELLLQYLESRILPGFVALDGGRICGFCFCVYEGQKAVVGDIFVDPSEPAPIAVLHTLIHHLLELLEASPDVYRIEAQLLLFDEAVLPPIFSGLAAKDTQVKAFPRLFLELDLAGAREAGETRRDAKLTKPADLELCRWSPTFYQAAAELIQHSYHGHLDSDINDQYRTVAGSQRFLHNIIRFPGCGTFDPENSFVLRERRSNNLVAVILCSRVGSETAHVTQLCVAPEYRGRRLGASLLHTALESLRARGFHFLTLTVSEANTPALKLYRATGFRTRHRFDALVLEKPSRALRLLPFLHAR